MAGKGAIVYKPRPVLYEQQHDFQSFSDTEGGQNLKIENTKWKILLLWESDYKSTKTASNIGFVWYPFAIFSSEKQNDTNMKHFIIIGHRPGGMDHRPCQTQTNHAFSATCFQQANAGKTVIKGNYVKPDWALP